MKRNQPEFFRSKLDEDPQFFIDGIKNITQIMDVTKEERMELATKKEQR